MDVYEDLYLQTNTHTFYFLKNCVVYRSDDGVIMKEWLFKSKDLLDDLVLPGYSVNVLPTLRKKC